MVASCRSLCLTKRLLCFLGQNDSIDLGMAAVNGLISKTKLDPKHIDQLIMGNVVVNAAAPNLAREIVIGVSASVVRSFMRLVWHLDLLRHHA